MIHSDVSQEVVGDERSALQAVVAADVELMELREEEEQLNKQLQDTSIEDKPKDFDADEASERLNEVGAEHVFVLPRPALPCLALPCSALPCPDMSSFFEYQM